MSVAHANSKSTTVCVAHVTHSGIVLPKPLPQIQEISKSYQQTMKNNMSNRAAPIVHVTPASMKTYCVHVPHLSVASHVHLQ